VVSKEAPIGLAIAEKLFGLLTLIIGAILIYFTSTNPPAEGGEVVGYSLVFMIAGLALVAIGILLVLARTES